MRAPSKTHERARALRSTLSLPEAMLWARLRLRDPARPALRRQHPIGPFIADFYCAAARVVIEIDGAFHGEEAQSDHDSRRDSYMERKGYRVIRFPAADVMAEADAVALSIFEVTATIAPQTTLGRTKRDQAGGKSQR